MEQIQIRNLSFSYPDSGSDCLKDVSLSIQKGEFVLLCGASGCGKTTLLRHLKSVLTPRGTRSGTVLYCGMPLDQVPPAGQAQAIGFVMQNPDDQIVTDKVWHELAFGLENLGVPRDVIGARVAEMASFFGIQSWYHRETSQLSGGQKQLLNLASIMAMQPEILILDEPTTGLDPQTRTNLWQVIGRLRREQGMTVFLTTHYMEEAADADYVVIIDHGRIAAEGTPLTLKNTYTGDFITLYGITEEQVKTLGASYESIRDAYRVFVKDTAAATELILRYPEIFRDYEITKGKMDDVFLAVTGKKLTGGEEK